MAKAIELLLVCFAMLAICTVLGCNVIMTLLE